MQFSSVYRDGMTFVEVICIKRELGQMVKQPTEGLCIMLEECHDPSMGMNH